MKRTLNIIYFLFLIFLYRISNGYNMILLTFSFSLYFLFKSFLSRVEVFDVLHKYQNEKKYYTRDRIFKYCLLITSIIIILMLTISYLVGNIIGIKNLNIINIIMVISLGINIIIKLYSQYLDIIGYKKIASKLGNFNDIIIIALTVVVAILGFTVFKVDVSYLVMYLYLPSIIVPIILIILVYLFVIRKRPKVLKKREEVGINLIKVIRNNFILDRKGIIYKVIGSAYLYFSIIIMYYVLLNKYNYDFDEVGLLITNTYFYGFLLLQFIFPIIKRFYSKEFEELKGKIKKPNEVVDSYFNDYISKVIKTGLSLTIILCIISGPACYLLFGVKLNFLFNICLFIFIYLLYDAIINIGLLIIREKVITIVLTTSLIIKLICEVPFIMVLYRMGYNLVLGSILSTLLGLITSIFAFLFIIRGKLKLSLLDNFSRILNIIYESIILCFILVMFTLIVKVDTKTYLSSFLVCIFYVGVALSFYYIKGKLFKGTD